MIAVTLSADSLALGDVVHGTASWSAEKPPKKVTAVLRWYTEGRGDTDEEDVAEAELTLGDSAFGLTTSFSFTLTIPEDSPPSYDGAILRILWSVDVRLDIPWGRDDKASAPLTVTLS